MSVYSGTLTFRSVHPASPVLLTKGQTKWESDFDLTPETSRLSPLFPRLKEFRNKSLVGTKYSKNLTDTRILSLSFIFPHGHRPKEKNLCEYINGEYCLPDCLASTIAPPPSAQTTFELLLKIHQNIEIESNQPEPPSLVKDVLIGFNNRLKQWNTSPSMTENQFSEQAVFPLLQWALDLVPK
ncbi:hypothetical protein BD770DRAFT_240868 [Pilaira anomala]|nr:hypothetical protein BD770DRAFT_240868 [Pilaira anomala]